MLQYLLDIIDKRLTIMLQSLRSPTSIAEISSRLAPEEAALLRYFNDTLIKWKEKILLRPP
jgi:DNA replication factor GINS